MNLCLFCNVLYILVIRLKRTHAESGREFGAEDISVKEEGRDMRVGRTV
jgi:hypothetical protein